MSWVSVLLSQSLHALHLDWRTEMLSRELLLAELSTSLLDRAPVLLHVTPVMGLRMEARAGTNERRQRKREPPCPGCDLSMWLSELSHRGKRLFRTMLNTLYFLYECGYKIFAAFNSLQSLSHVWCLATPWNAHARPPCPSPSPGVDLNSCPLTR